MKSSTGREIMSRVDWRARQLCKYCDDLQHTGSHENTMVLCDCCVATGAHVKCLAKHEGKVITPEQINSPAFTWFCGPVCNQIHVSLVDRTGSGMSLDAAGTFTVELVHYSKIDGQSQNATIRAAEEMFKAAFVPTPCADGRDMIEVVCRGEIGQEDASELPGNDDDSEEPVPDCTNFRVFVLKKGGTIVSAAAIRVHGDLFVEIPYVATREGYRRQGNCHRLMTALESFLSDIGVRWILLQADKSSVPMWTKRFGFMRAIGKVASQVQDRIVILNKTKVLLKMIKKTEGSMPTQREVEKSRKRQRIRFGHPIATILGDDEVQKGTYKCFVEETFKSRELIPKVPVQSSNLVQNPNINGMKIDSRSCINCKVLNSCRWHRDSKDHWVCNACHGCERRTGQLCPPSKSSKTFKLESEGTVKTEAPAWPDTNDCKELERQHDDPYPSKKTAMDVLDSEKVADCDDQVQNTIPLHGTVPEVQRDPGTFGTKFQGINWVHEHSGTSTTTAFEKDDDTDEDEDQGGGIDNKEEDVAAITAHLENFVANQLQAVAILQDAMDMNESLLHSTIMNAAMDARIAVIDTHSFGFLPAGNKKQCLLSPRSLTALVGATEDAVRYAQATVDRFQQQSSVQTT